MPQLKFTTVDVFTATRYAGNPLAIVHIPYTPGPTAAADDEDDPSTRGPSTAQLQAIAREFNLSETVFLYDNDHSTPASSAPHWRVRIFLTTAELPLAGHPLIGTACYALGTLAPGVQEAVFTTNAGRVRLEFDSLTGVARAEIPVDVHVHTQFAVGVEDVWKLQPGLSGDGALQQLHKQQQQQQDHSSSPLIALVSPVKGMTFLFVRVSSLALLGEITLSTPPHPRRDLGWDHGFLGSHFYVITSETATSIALQARMVEGSFEDPATGSAACALAALLALRKEPPVRELEVRITQGVEMGRRSEIGVEVRLTEELDEVERVVLFGGAVGVMQGAVEY